ncbi:hypothetical protein PSPO01_16164 [Paraphaeosphaeria sporulosa]
MYCSRCRKSFGPSSTCYCKPPSALRQSAPPSAATPNPRERLGMQMRASYKDTIQKIFKEIIVFLSSPRAQTAGPESFDKLAKGYAELSRVCNGNNLEDIFAPIATLASEYLGVPDVNGLLRGDYEISSPDAEVDSPVLAITDEQLDEMRSSGQKLPARVSCVLVPTKPGRKIDDTFEVFQAQCKGWDTTIINNTLSHQEMQRRGGSNWFHAIGRLLRPRD